MTKLCPRGKSAAKRKFKVYPSAYANAYASKICAGKIKDPSGTKRKDWGPKKANKGMLMEKAKKAYDLTQKHDTFSGSGVSPKGRLKIALNRIKQGKNPVFKSRPEIRSMIRDMQKIKKAKEGRMFTAAQVRALDESTGSKVNPKKKERIMQSGDKDKIKLSKTNLKRFSTGMSYKDMEPYGGKYAKKKSEMKAKASENVKRLTTQPSAYDPEKRYIVGTQRKGNARRVMVKTTTDQVNLKEAASKLKGDMGPGARVNVYDKGQAMRNRVIRTPKRKLSNGGIAKGMGAAIKGGKFEGVF